VKGAVVLATRGSPLALWQARAVQDRLRAIHPDREVELLVVKTEGDRVQDRPLSELSGTGVFTKEVDARVRNGDAHGAVHSLKDQLTKLPEGITLGMVLPRGPAEDALVGRISMTLAELPPGARFATGSLRRRAQILAARPDLIPVPSRGNVDTRLGKLDAGEADALVLARAGLERLGLGDRITEVIAPQTCLPAVSQGIVGVTCRTDDDATRAILHEADHSETRVRAEAERAWLCALGGGCNVPAAAHATVDGDRLHLLARVLSGDGRVCLEDALDGDVTDAARIGETLANDLLARGAGDLIREARQ